MSQDRVTEVYEGVVSSPQHHQIVRQRVHWMCSQVAGTEILDIGCSQGIATILLAREGKRVVGLDRDLGLLEFARDRLLDEEPAVQDRVSFVAGEAADLQFEDQSFDTVILGELLEHLVDPTPVLDEARRVTRVGGRVILTTPYGLHTHVDHKEPVYLHSLLDRLQPRFDIETIELIDRYLAVVAKPRGRLARRAAPSIWTEALGLAEKRLAEQDLVAEGRKEKLKRAYAQRDSLLEKYGRVEAQREAAEARAGAVRNELVELRERNEILEARVVELESIASAREAANGTSSAAVEQLRRELEHRHEELTALREEREHRRKELIALRAQLDALTALRVELEQRNEDLTAVRAELEQRDDDLTALRAELRRTKQHLSLRSEQVSEIYGSRSYRLVRMVWRMRKTLTPGGSRNEGRPALTAGDGNGASPDDASR